MRTVIAVTILAMGIMATNPLRAEQTAAATGSQAELSRAATANKYLFVFVTENNDDATQAARKTFETAAGKLADQAAWITVDRTDAAEKEFVQKYGLAQAPMPLVLAFAPNGAITGGFPAAQLTEQRLRDALVSPGMQHCLKALQERKLVLVCVQNGNTKSNDVALQGVNDFKADARFAKVTEVVKIDPTVAAEAKFLGQLQIDPKATEATTALLAPPGAVLAKFTGATEKKTLEAALQKASSGCGPGASSGCCPAPKK
jgi:hypothetical protein